MLSRHQQSTVNSQQSQPHRPFRLLHTSSLTIIAAGTCTYRSHNSRQKTRRNMNRPSLLLLHLSLLLLLQLSFSSASRFRVNSPVLTVTLKDPMVDSSSSSSPRSKWLDLNNIRPNLHWSFQSTSKPLPKWLPSLQSLQGTVGYHYDQMKRAPTFLEGGVKFRKGDVELDILPTYQVKSQRTTLMLQVSKGPNLFGMAKFRDAALELIRACYQIDLPYASVGAIRVTPTWNVMRGEPSCVLEGTTGSQRTKAVVNLEYQNPTLTVVHALDDRYVLKFLTNYSLSYLFGRPCFVRIRRLTQYCLSSSHY
jgi:hypothetical protein